MKRDEARAATKGVRPKGIITGALAVFCVLALTATLIENRGKRTHDIRQSSVISFVVERYGLLAGGKYDVLSRDVAEGLWKRGAADWQLEGLVTPADEARQLDEDLGVGAWRLHFVSLKAVELKVVSRSDFKTLMRRESQILNAIDPAQKIQSVSIVSMKGHNTGSCSIVEWERQIPVVEKDGTYLILMRGAPDVYSLVHNEQWFQPVRF